MALVGFVDAITRAGVSGWAANPDDPTTPVALTVLVNGEPGVTGVADQPRPGLATSTQGRATDHSAFRFEFDPPLSAFRQYKVEVVERAGGKPLPGGVHTLAQPGRDATATLAPIIVNATGGEAVTRLLAEFARHPAIVIADRAPYETRQIGYYAATFATVTAAAAARARPAGQDTALLPPPSAGVAANPHNSAVFYDLVRPRTLLQTFYETRVPAHYATLFRTLILEFYETLRAGQGSHGAPYFCERGDLDDAARQAARVFFPQVKELVLVRDPRDVLAAGITVFKLPVEQAMAALHRVVATLSAIHAEAAPDVLLLRQEDLTLEPAASHRAIGGFLGLDLSPPAAAARPDPDPGAPIGRWRHELSADQVSACEAAFAGFMASFDYKPGQAAGPATALVQAAPMPARSPAVPPPQATAKAAPASAAAAASASIAAPRVAPAPAAPVAKPIEPAAKPDPTAALPAMPQQQVGAPPPSRPSIAGVVLEAEGAAAIAALRARDEARAGDGRPLRPVVKLEFGAGLPGVAQLGPGWSRPEPGHVWSVGRQCRLSLPPLQGDGPHRVRLCAAPLLHPEKLPEQSVTVLVNTVEVGTVTLRGPAVLAFDVPPPIVAAGGGIAVTLRLPNAAKPTDLGDSNDERLLGVSLRWLQVLQSPPP